MSDKRITYVVLHKEKVEAIINEVEDRIPYKLSGCGESYLKYSEGWSDACDVIRKEIIDYLIGK